MNNAAPGKGQTTGRFPGWIKVKLPTGRQYGKMNALLDHYGLKTVCRHALCPNIGECYSKGTATFLILGPHCTRNCGYCRVDAGHPPAPGREEPANIAAAVKELNLSYAVVTSVTRDDLPDGGAAHFAATVRELKALEPACRVELLIPDLQGNAAALETILAAAPDVLGHNLETVERLFPGVRPQGNYRLSLKLLRMAGEIRPELPLKSGIMIGLGERAEDISRTLEDLATCGVRMLTIGQYLRPGKAFYPVHKYYHPDKFDHLKQRALQMGFRCVAAAPLVRSSYHAGELYHGYTHPA